MSLLLSHNLAPASIHETLPLLEELNGLRNDAGVRYASMVTHHGFETWWCHQQATLDLFLLPFIRYRPLLERCAGGESVIIHDCPPDLRRILPFVRGGDRVELVDSRSEPARFRSLRRLASGLVYRLATAIALGRTVLRPAEYLVYSFDSTDSDGRNRWIDGLHEALDRRGTRFLEIVWSDGGARALRQLRARRRSVLFWQAIAPPLRADSPIRTDRVEVGSDDMRSSYLRTIAEAVLLPRARASVATVRRFERLLRSIRPRGVFLMDDPAHVWELVIACKRCRVPTVAVQHGQISRATAGLMGYGYRSVADLAFDRYCVWSDFFRELLERHSDLIPARAIVVGGRPRARGGSPPGSVAERGGSVVLLAEHYDATIQEQEVERYVRALLDVGIDVRLKLHPSIARPPRIANEDRAACGAPEAVGTMEEVLASAAVVVASFSSAIFEAIEREVPVVLFATSLYSDPHGLAEAGIADLARSPAAIAALVRSAAKLPPHELARRRERVWGSDAGGMDGGEAALHAMEGLRASKGNRQADVR